MTGLQTIARHIPKQEIPFIALIVVLIAFFFIHGHKSSPRGQQHEAGLSPRAEQMSVNTVQTPAESTITVSGEQQNITPSVPPSGRFGKRLKPLPPAADASDLADSFREKTEPRREIRSKEMRARQQRHAPDVNGRGNVSPAAAQSELVLI